MTAKKKKISYRKQYEHVQSYLFIAIQIYKVKDKKHKEDEIHSSKKLDKELLLWLVKIFHADPVFAFHVSFPLLSQTDFTTKYFYIFLLHLSQKKALL